MREVVGYMCLTDFDHELGCASDGSRVFPSVKTLKRHCPCIAQCGIAQVRVTGVSVLQKPDFSSSLGDE